MFCATQNMNLDMANEKRQREIAQNKMDELLKQEEVEATLNDKFMTEHPSTEQSMLAPHRVKPYHFKGLRPE